MTDTLDTCPWTINSIYAEDASSRPKTTVGRCTTQREWAAKPLEQLLRPGDRRV
ncbi:hypothetical protein AArcMg_1549 [Natrarchaeobaculum sulfurireducens]|uniref:Uncharacterized protein n=1 Tax=Natrarchaeobaculum sulfurireducens TaxID=2044521 RepID=A0A346PFW7_9EURY|nr:hypothetical protein AArc1_2094 [Natrarchaeobaculum sulfurireducens]AXR81561.1 hypothetical protein AArcMg_1549 [Natrarchaeobaculum sulfurireducens]